MCLVRTLGIALSLLVITTAVYWPVRRAGFIWDDNDHLTENPAVTAPDGLVKIWTSLSVSRYYPLTLTTFWVQRQLWGFNPLPYHAVNVVLHGLNAILVYLVLHRLRVRAAWVAAAVWALHPVNVESVAWITELKNVQSGLFFFLSLLCFLESERTDSGAWYSLSIVCAGAAMLSKTSTVILPLVLLLCIWWQRSRLTRRDWLRVAPFFLIALPMGLLTVAEQQGEVKHNLEQAWSLGFPDRVAIAGRALWFYTAKLLCPTKLSFIYPRWTAVARSPQSWLGWLGIATVLAVGWRWRRTSWARAVLFGTCCFGAALLPVLGFFNIYFFRYSFVADHFQYLASVGLLACVVAGVATIMQNQRLRMTIAIAALATLAILTRQHIPTFADEESLWRDTISRNPQAVMAQNNLGLLFYGRLQYRQAIRRFETALETDPNFLDAHYNLGLVLTELGHYPAAERQMQRALELAPYFAKAENGLGFILLQQGQHEDAAEHCRRALELDPHCVEAHNNLGTIFLSLGEIEDAEGQFRQASKIRPTDAIAHKNLGLTLFKQHRLDEAASEFQEAVRLGPDDPAPHRNLADIFSAQQKLEDAQQQRMLATSLAHRLGETHYRIATSLQDSADLDGAIKHLRKSIFFLPTFGNAYIALSKVLVDQARFAEAVATLRLGVEAVPDDPLVRNELAWLLATCSDSNVRNGEQAAAIAKQMIRSPGPHLPELLDTLAAAQAEIGHFEEASRTAREAIAAATAQSRTGMINSISVRLHLYENRQPYRLPTP